MEVPAQFAFRVKSTFVELLNDPPQGIADTFNGARFADGVDAENVLVQRDLFAVKYLQPEATSNQRVYLKATLTNPCRDFSFLNCSASNYELYFFSPTKRSLVGFTLGGYVVGGPDVTNAILTQKLE